jgi:DNA-binding transcriptional LysR family regulator
VTGSDVSSSFRLAYVPGVMPGKWVRTWQERVPGIALALVTVSAAEAADLALDRAVDAVLLRLPVERAGLHTIPLYTETTVVVAPKDHLVAAADEVSSGDLADDVVLHPLDDTLDWRQPPGLQAAERPAATADAIPLVAAGVGLLVVPQSLARLHHRRDLIYRPLSDAPRSRVALSWPEEETTDLMEQFIGVVRGRTVNSTRGRPPTPTQPKSDRPNTQVRKPGKSTGRNRQAPQGRKRGKPRRRS